MALTVLEVWWSTVKDSFVISCTDSFSIVQSCPANDPLCCVLECALPDGWGKILCPVRTFLSVSSADPVLIVTYSPDDEPFSWLCCCFSEGCYSSLLEATHCTLMLGHLGCLVIAFLNAESTALLSNSSTLAFGPIRAAICWRFERYSIPASILT